MIINKCCLISCDFTLLYTRISFIVTVFQTLTNASEGSRVATRVIGRPVKIRMEVTLASVKTDTSGTGYYAQVSYDPHYVQDNVL